jgi:hypothetical protein
MAQWQPINRARAPYGSMIGSTRGKCLHKRIANIVIIGGISRDTKASFRLDTCCIFLGYMTVTKSWGSFDGVYNKLDNVTN